MFTESLFKEYCWASAGLNYQTKINLTFRATGSKFGTGINLIVTNLLLLSVQTVQLLLLLTLA
jgi:hypothetical protein